MPQGPALAPSALPLSHYPEEKNRRKKKQQINRNQRGQANSNHGAVVDVAFGRATSFPHSIVAIPQLRA